LQRIALHLFAAQLSVAVFGQNMLSNGGFEAIITPPNYYAQICDANTWSSPNNNCSVVVGCGTPDDYNTLGSGGANPPNTWWATVSPHSGNGMVGFAPWYVASPTFREYIRAQLTTPLITDNSYQVSFWLTNGVSTLHPYGISRIGVAFSTSALTQTCGNNIIYTPQIEIPQVVYSTMWQYFSFTFTAGAPYQYICIGNFVPYASVVAQKIGTVGNSGAYYYIDDINVHANTVLPIELLAFNATAQNDRSVMCEWITATESGNDHFDVERSPNANDWQRIGELKGAGTSTSEHRYALVDPAPLDGQNYYRLKQVDIDGAFTYSDVRQVDLSSAGAGFTVWPDPSDGDASVALSAKASHDITLEVDDAQGRRVMQRSLSPGERTTISELPPGCYLLRAADDASVLPRRLVVR